MRARRLGALLCVFLCLGIVLCVFSQADSRTIPAVDIAAGAAAGAVEAGTESRLEENPIDAFFQGTNWDITSTLAMRIVAAEEYNAWKKELDHAWQWAEDSLPPDSESLRLQIETAHKAFLEYAESDAEWRTMVQWCGAYSPYGSGSPDSFVNGNYAFWLSVRKADLYREKTLELRRFLSAENPDRPLDFIFDRNAVIKEMEEFGLCFNEDQTAVSEVPYES